MPDDIEKSSSHDDTSKPTGVESDDEEVFYDARFPPDEEADLLSQSKTHKSEANGLFSSSHYSEAISIYDRALSFCPNYLDFDVAVLQSNIAACHLKLEDWKSAVDAATASITSLERLLPTSSPSPSNVNQKSSGSGSGLTTSEASPQVVELEDGGDHDQEEAELKKLADNDARREDVKRIRSKSLMRRARGNMELDGWASLQSAEEDYKQLLELRALPPQDQRAVHKALRELPARINVAKEKETAEMMGKLKDLGNGILKPFGLSTENFKFIKDENSGGYSMSFEK